MKLVIQRVQRGSVTVFDAESTGKVDGKRIAEIGRGLVLLVGFCVGDKPELLPSIVEKVLGLRIFDDGTGKMNRSVAEVNGELLVVSQFTLCADTRRGRRPSFTGAMPPAEAEAMYEEFVQLLKSSGLKVATGLFAAKMSVEIINDGPVTFILEDEAH